MAEMIPPGDMDGVKGAAGQSGHVDVEEAVEERMFPGGDHEARLRCHARKASENFPVRGTKHRPVKTS